MSESRLPTVKLSSLLFRLAYSGKKRAAMITDLRKGVCIRFGEDASIDTKLCEREARELESGVMPRKLRILVEAVASSDQWTEAHDLYKAHIYRDVWTLRS